MSNSDTKLRLCTTCKKKVQTVRRNVTLPILVDGAEHAVPEVPARVCPECDDVVSMPRESTPILTEARERIRARG